MVSRRDGLRQLTDILVSQVAEILLSVEIEVSKKQQHTNRLMQIKGCEASGCFCMVYIPVLKGIEVVHVSFQVCTELIRRWTSHLSLYLDSLSNQVLYR